MVPISSQGLPLQWGGEWGAMEVQTDAVSTHKHPFHAFLPATATMGPQWLMGSSCPGILGSRGGKYQCFLRNPQMAAGSRVRGGKALSPPADKCFPLCRAGSGPGGLSGLCSLTSLTRTQPGSMALQMLGDGRRPGLSLAGFGIQLRMTASPRVSLRTTIAFLESLWLGAGGCAV